MSNTQPVIFRVWKDEPKSVIAFFPTVPTDVNGYHCESYEHVGQHSGADYDACISHTRPATEAEYYPLLEELARIGYRNLRVVRRQTYEMMQTRMREAAR